MHFLIHRNLRASPVIRWTLAAYTFGLALFLSFRPWLENLRTGITPAEYWRAVHGDPKMFVLPTSAIDFVSRIHVDLFIDSLLAIVLVAVLIRLPVAPLFRRITAPTLLILPVVLTVAASLVLQGFAWATIVRVAAFWLLWAAHCLVAGRVLIYLLRPGQT